MSATHQTQPNVGWVMDFDNGSIENGIVSFIRRATSTSEQARLTTKIEDGTLLLGGKFDEESINAGDYASVRWRDMNSLSISEYPILEIRCWIPKGGAMLVLPTYQFQDGSTSHPYYTFVPSNPEGWQTLKIRIAGDISLPKKSTPRKLVELELWLEPGVPSDLALKIDWVKLRPFNAEEQACECEWIALMKEYQSREPSSLREFFPFGVYADAYSGASQCKLSPEHSLSVLARSRFNFVLAGRDLWAATEPMNPKNAVYPLMQAADATGMKFLSRIRTMPLVFASKGEGAARDWAGRIVAHTRGNSSVLGYDLGDEPGIDSLWSLMAAKKIIETLDPEKTAVMTTWDVEAVKAFDPYQTVVLTDRYPMTSGKQLDPMNMFNWCRDIAKLSNNKRHWVVLQSFGKNPWAASSYDVPTPEELREMTYASLAGGARGIVYFSYSVPSFRMLADQWCNPNELCREAGNLAQTLVPICGRLLDTIVDFDTTLKPGNLRVAAGVLYDPVRKVRYIVAFNTNTKGRESGEFTLPSAWKSDSRRIYDLYSMREASPDATRLMVDALEPGGGRVYLVGSKGNFEADKRSIMMAQMKEELRIQTPDISIARRYKVDLRNVNILRSSALVLAKKGRMHDSLAKAKEAGTALSAVMEGVAPYSSARDRLEEIARLMGVVEPAMHKDNNTHAQKMSGLRDEYWNLHERWSSAFDRAMQGSTEGLNAEVSRLEGDARRIAGEANRILAGEPSIQGAFK